MFSNQLSRRTLLLCEVHYQRGYAVAMNNGEGPRKAAAVRRAAPPSGRDCGVGCLPPRMVVRPQGRPAAESSQHTHPRAAAQDSYNIFAVERRSTLHQVPPAIPPRRTYLLWPSVSRALRSSLTGLDRAMRRRCVGSLQDCIMLSPSTARLTCRVAALLQLVRCMIHALQPLVKQLVFYRYVLTMGDSLMRTNRQLLKDASVDMILITYADIVFSDLTLRVLRSVGWTLKEVRTVQ